jgi:HK97 family phage major capsid protein
MLTLAQIDARLAEIRTALQNPETANLDELQTEMNQLLEERAQRIAEAEQRRTMLEQIANGTAQGLSAPVAPGTPDGSQNSGSEERNVLSTPEYRSAFFHHLMGLPLNAAERAAFDQAEQRAALTSASNSAGAAIPTETQNEIVRRLAQVAPLIGEITLFNIPGNITVAVESATTTDGAIHTEGASASESSDKLAAVNLTGFEAIKLLSISAKVKYMTVPAFESWLIENLTDGIAYLIEGWIINGTGSSQPTGIEKAPGASWTANTNKITCAASIPTYAEVCNLISLLPGVYDRRAQFVMSKKTLWQKFMPIRDDSKAPIVKGEGAGQYYIMGYPVLLSDKVSTLGDCYFGDLKTYYGNFAENITVDKSDHSSFRNNLTDYRGTAIFDGKPAVPDGFVKMSLT